MIRLLASNAYWNGVVPRWAVGICEAATPVARLYWRPSGRAVRSAHLVVWAVMQRGSGDAELPANGIRQAPPMGGEPPGHLYPAGSWLGLIGATRTQEALQACCG